MSVNKIVTKVDGVINKTIDFNDLKAGLSAGAHTITVEAWNGATLISTQTKNITIAGASSFEAETTAYMNAVGIVDDSTVYYSGTPQEITGAEMWSAINNYVVAMKNAAILSKMKAIYPFIGGTAATHKWNLKNPLDTDAAFRLVFFGSSTFAATGFKSNGANGYANTKYIQNTHGILNDESFGFYSRTNNEGLTYDMGVQQDSLNTRSIILSRFSDLFYTSNQDNSYQTLINTNSIGFYSASRLQSTLYRKQKGSVITDATETSTVLATAEMFLGAANYNGAANYFSAREQAYAFMGLGLTTTEMTDHYNAVENLQISLKRNV